MPHLTIEYSRPALDEARLGELIDALIGVADRSDVIELTNVKLRAIPLDHFRVGANVEPFVHIGVALMAGRPKADLSGLSNQIFDAAADLLPDVDQVTVDIRQTDPDTYRKRAS